MNLRYDASSRPPSGPFTATLWRGMTTSRITTLVEAKATLSEPIQAVEKGESVFITRHGKAVVALVPAIGGLRLGELQARRSETGLASIAGGWEGSEELADILVRRLRASRRHSIRLEESS